MTSNYQSTPIAEGLELDDRPERQKKELYTDGLIPNDAPAAAIDDEKQVVVASKERRYCGLRPKVFWIVSGVLLVLIVAAAVGGGVGGSQASRANRDAQSSSSSSSSSTNANTGFSSLPSSSTQLSNSVSVNPSSTSTFTSRSSSSTTSLATSTAIVCPSGILCNDSKCQGRNDPNGAGFCFSVGLSACRCFSICGDTVTKCSACGGKDNICEEGTLRGCNCST